MITNSIAPYKPGPRPASTEIRPVDSPEDSSATGTRDFHTDGHQLPNPGIAQQTAPIDARDRSEGGHLDRTAWAYDFSRRHQLTKPERSVLLYMAHRAGPQRLFQCDDSEEQIADWTDYERKAINRAIKGLINKGAIYQTRKGKGGNHVASRYRLRGSETDWRVEGTPDSPNGTPGGIGDSQRDSKGHGNAANETPEDIGDSQWDSKGHGNAANETPGDIGDSQWDSKGHGNAANETPGDSQCDPESFPMRPGVPYHPINHPVLPPVVSSKNDETTTTTTRERESTKAELSLSSSDSRFKKDESEVSKNLDHPNVCENCEATTFRDHHLCIPHLVDLFWPQLGPTWEKGPRAAIRWYGQHPDDFEEQIRELGPTVLTNLLRAEADGKEISATAEPPVPPPHLDGGKFRCDRCERTITLADVAMDGHLHRGYDYRHENGGIEHRRCGGTWERIDDELEG